MPEMPQRSPATNAAGPLAPGSVLRLDEEMLDITELAAIDAAALDGALADHSIALSMPGKLDREGAEILRLWPAKIWC